MILPPKTMLWSSLKLHILWEMLSVVSCQFIVQKHKCLVECDIEYSMESLYSYSDIYDFLFRYSDICDFFFRYSDIQKYFFRYSDIWPPIAPPPPPPLTANIRKIDEIQIQRCYAINVVDDPFIVQLIGFSDAPQLAYGCCIYFKFIYSSGKVKVSFVTSKSRIVPLKKHITIPRLELLGNVPLCRLVKSVIGAVKMELEIKNVFCFTDSQVALAWIRNEDKEKKQFVQNRVNEIRRNVPPINWCYCETLDKCIIKGLRSNYCKQILLSVNILLCS